MRLLRQIASIPGAFQINVLTHLHSRRDMALRLAVVSAVGLAALFPFLIDSGGSSVEDVAGEQFLAALAELDEAQVQLARLRNDSNADPVSVQALEAGIADLERETTLGYLPRDGDAPRAGALAPDFRLLNLDGNPVHLSALGTPAVVNFWASWCTFCIEEMPDFQRLQEQVEDRAVVIGINRAESLKVARQFADQTGAGYPLVLDLEDELGDRGGPYQIVGMPTTYYVAADGRIATVKVGIHSFEEMLRLMNELLDEDIAVEEEPIDASYVAQATNLLDSQRANHAVARELFNRFASDPAVVQDLAWQRNIVAQARAWTANGDAWQALAPPETLQALDVEVAEAFQLFQTASTFLQSVVEARDGVRIQRGIDLFSEAAGVFQEAADNFVDVASALEASAGS